MPQQSRQRTGLCWGATTAMPEMLSSSLLSLLASAFPRLIGTGEAGLGDQGVSGPHRLAGCHAPVPAPRQAGGWGIGGPGRPLGLSSMQAG